MANKTIPQLPEQTGKTDNDLLAIVDSGETTTSKIKVSTLLSGVGGKYIAADGTNNIVPDYFPTSSIASGQTNSVIVGGFSGNTITGADNNQFLIGGTGLSIDGGDNSGIIGGQSNSIGAQGNNDVIVGGISNTITNDAYRRGMFAGNNNSMGFGWQSVIIGGRDHSKTSGNDGGIFAGNTNTLSSTGINNVVIGGNNNALTGGDRAFLIGGQNNTHSSLYGGVVGGQSNTNGERSYIFGGNSNSVAGDITAVGTQNFSSSVRLNSPNSGHIIAGGRYHSSNTNNAQRQTWLGGYSNKIWASGLSEGMVHIGGVNNWIGGGTFASPTQVPVNLAYQANSQDSQISGGTQNAIINSLECNLNAGTTNTTIIGCNGVAGDASDMVYVPALILANYASYNFVDDVAAAAGGVKLGGIYHNAGDLRVRIT
jgi:hypothetical protein